MFEQSQACYKMSTDVYWWIDETNRFLSSFHMTSDSFTAICGLRMKNVFPNISEQFELLILALSKYIGAYGGEFTALKHRLISWGKLRFFC